MSLFPWMRTPPPDVAVEIDRTHVSAARIERRGGQAVVAAHAVEPLPAGVVTPSIAAANLADGGAVGEAVARVLRQVGGRTSRVALVVPDTVAKVSLVRLEKVPGRQEDLREIVRWQMRKSAPFPVEQAVLSVSAGAPVADGGREFVVALAREDVVRQYEQACAMAGAHAGLVDLATFSVLNSVIAGGGAPAGDWLLVHVADSYITLAVYGAST
ncbi:MAG: pilus assembly protein PilM [Vicinamibacterales bacterium]